MKILIFLIIIIEVYFIGYLAQNINFMEKIEKGDKEAIKCLIKLNK